MLVTTAHRIRFLIGSLTLCSAAVVPSATLAVDLYSQNFESVSLGPIVTYQVLTREREAWTATPPAGMTVDNSLMPSSVMADPNEGVTEFEGWTFVDKSWWASAAGDQGRTQFLSGLGKVAVADNDTHDDFGNPDAVGPFDSTLSTPSITIPGGTAANSINLNFRSSWVPEDNPTEAQGDQKATVTARYNNGTVEVLRWRSKATDSQFHAAALDENVTIPLQNPAGATSVILDFRLFDATNNWWWALDNLRVYTGAAAATDGVLRAIIDRTTSDVKIVNNTGAAVSLRGYSLRSSAGAFNEPNAAFKADSDSNWVQFTAPNATGDLSEGHKSSFSFAAGGTIDLGNNVWRKYYQDSSDLTFEYLMAGNDNPIPAIVEFAGNGGTSYRFLDLNFDGSINALDWDTFRAGFPSSLSGLSIVQRYQLGDLDNDGQHSAADFLKFRTTYNASLGAGAFEAMIAAAVPEPTSGLLLLTGAMTLYGIRRRELSGSRGGLLIAVALVMVLLGQSSGKVHAQLTLLNENFNSLPLGPSIEEPNAAPNVWTDTPPAGWVVDDSGVPGNGPDVPDPNNGRIEWSGWAFTDKVWWSTQVDDQLRSTFTLASGAVMVADPDEWDDEAHPLGLYNAFVTTPSIAIPAGIPAGRIKIAFDSSWRPECCDDDPGLANNQRATVKVSYDGGAPTTVVQFDSDPAIAATYHPDAPNESIQKDLGYNGSSTSLKLTFGLDLAENDWWWAVDNLRVFVPANPLKLRVNQATGQATIVGDDVIATPVNFVDVKSDSGALIGGGLSGLSTRKPDSVDGTDPDSSLGSTSGEFWQNLSATNGRVTEAFLLGSSSFTSARSESLGNIFNTGGAHDLVFTYTNIFNDVVTGVVEYFTPVGVPGDYNNNGVVDAADYVLWRNGGPLQNEVDNPGTVNAADYTAWRARFGNTSGSGSGVNGAAVPEASTFQLLTLCVVGLFLGCSRRFSRTASAVTSEIRPASVGWKLVHIAAGFMTVAMVVEKASAALPPPPVLDRNYQMGDDPTEAAVAGAAVGSGNPSGLATRDSQGVAGQQQLIHLVPNGGPLYEALSTVSGGPVPKRPDNGTGLAIRLNPTSTSQGQYLKTGFEQALNYPELSYSSIGQPGGTLDYTFIKDRGFQLWVLPQTNARADIVMDTNQHGALINSSGNFAMRYINTDYDTGIPAVPNTWYHLMVIRPFGPGQGSIMYVNGKAVARAAGTYRGEDSATNEETTPLVVGANTGTTAFTVGAQNRFQGLVDDLQMFVMGLNSGHDYGDFVFERDNKYAAFFKPSNIADVNGDGSFNSTDVNVFASHWLSQHLVSGIAIGDLTSRLNGDLNYDGIVNLKDWDILNDAHPAAAAAAMALIGSVPEPSCVCLLMLALAGALSVRRRSVS